jgi:titin
VAESDRELYDPEKTGAAEVLIRAGQQDGDASLVDFGRKLTIYMLGDAAKENVPLGKLMGQDLTRIHPAVALLTNGAGAPPPPVPSAPNAPGALTAQAASSSAINLSWQDNSTNEDSFRVEQLVNGSYQEIKSLAAGTTAVQITGLAASTSYSFRVRAANTGGYSAYSNAAAAATPAIPTPPAAPTTLTAQAASTSAINLTWQDNSTNEDSFHVQELVNGAYQEIQILGPNMTSVQIGGLAAGTTYSFRVVAANAVGFSAYSNVASAATQSATPPPSPVPAAPTGLTARGGTVAGTIQLTWTDNSGNESSFRIEELTGGVYKEVYAVGANVTTALITGLNPGTSYSFRVRAANSSGYSAYSNVATGTSTPGTPPPTAPQITSATAVGGGAVQVKWRDNSSTEVQFVVEKSTNNSTFQTAATVAANSTTAKITGLTKGVKYYFRVKAVDAFGQASYSTVMMVTVR